MSPEVVVKNVILTAFACGKSAPCERWASEMFDEPAAVGWVPGANSSQFEASGRDAAADVESWAAAKARCPADEVGRIAVVTFSAGWGFAYRLLLNSAASERVDSLIVLDGIHTHDLSGFKRFAAKAATGSKMMVLAHSQIVPPYVPTKVTNREIMAAATQANPGSCELAPDYVTSALLPGPIACGNQYGRETYQSDPLVEQDNSGGAWRLEYRGGNAAIHIYIANHVQPRIWRMLADRWNSKA